MKLENEFIKVTENAAINCYKQLGKLDKNSLDKLAVEAMEKTLNTFTFNYKLCSGEGAIDVAPELVLNRKIANADTLEVIVDPIEGTTLAANNLNNAISTIGIGPSGSFLPVPDMYALKIFSPHKLDTNLDANSDLRSILQSVCLETGQSIGELKVAVLDKPRHIPIINQLLDLGVKIYKIPDGDVLVSLEMYKSKKYDLFYGIGGAPEGMLNAAIINFIGGFFSMKLLAMKTVKGDCATRTKEEEQELLSQYNLTFDQVLNINDVILASDYIVCATGVTDSVLLKGVYHDSPKAYVTNSILINRNSQRILESRHLDV